MSKLFKNHLYKQLLSLVIIIAAILTIVSVNFVRADVGPIIGDKVSGYTTTNPYEKGDYQLDDFVELAIKVAEIIWAISGSLALLMFVYGGILFLISSGHSQMVTRATQTMTSAVIGLAIVFGSYAIIYFIMVTVLHTKNPFSAGWFNP
jgi:hypothetical protein